MELPELKDYTSQQIRREGGISADFMQDFNRIFATLRALTERLDALEKQFKQHGREIAHHKHTYITGGEAWLTDSANHETLSPYRHAYSTEDEKKRWNTGTGYAPKQEEPVADEEPIVTRATCPHDLHHVEDTPAADQPKSGEAWSCERWLRIWIDPQGDIKAFVDGRWMQLRTQIHAVLNVELLTASSDIEAMDYVKSDLAKLRSDLADMVSREEYDKICMDLDIANNECRRLDHENDKHISEVGLYRAERDRLSTIEGAIDALNGHGAICFTTSGMYHLGNGELFILMPKKEGE